MSNLLANLAEHLLFPVGGKNGEMVLGFVFRDLPDQLPALQNTDDDFVVNLVNLFAEVLQFHKQVPFS